MARPLNSQFYVEMGGNHSTADNGALAWNFNLRRISKGY
jgi:hypothetical protein